MTDFHSRKILVGVFPVILHSGAKGRSVLGLGVTEFVGRFTLPFEAEWGEMVLPEGDYTLHFGKLDGDISSVEIAGQDPAMPQGIFLTERVDTPSVVQNALICVCRDGNRIIRSLELPLIGKAVSFAASQEGEVVRNYDTAVTAPPFEEWPN